MANRYIGEVAAPEFGDGFTIRLDMAGQAELESQFGDNDPNRIGVFLWRIQTGLSIMAAEYMLPFLKASLRKDDVLVREIPEFSPLEPVARKCLDALALFRYGKPHEQWVADNAKEVGRSTADPSLDTAA